MDPRSTISTPFISDINDTNIHNEIWKPDVIVLGPGGAKGYLILGFLLILEEDEYYIDVNEWIGCSIGASIALMVVSGYSVKEIIKDCIDVNIINDITDINFENFREKPGIFTIKTIENLMKLRMKQKFGKIPTLKELYMATGIVIKLITFNRTKMRPECLSKDSEPNLSCVEAVMMSMAIPGIVAPRTYKGCIYVDGALGDPYPILISDNGIKKILGIYIDSEQNETPVDYDKNTSTIMKVVTEWAKHMYDCVQASMKVLRDNAIKLASENCKHVALKTPIIDTTGITLDRNGKINMIESGYKRGSIFLNKIKNPDEYNVILDEDEELPIVDDIETKVDEIEVIRNDPCINPNLGLFNNEKVEDVYLSDIDDLEENNLTTMSPTIKRNMESNKHDDLKL